MTRTRPRTGTADFELHADEIVDAAVEIFHEGGLDAVSMRSVSTRLGVSPVPLYSRIGNRDALVEAIADRLLADLAPASAVDDALAHIDPDQLSPREALEALYQLKKLSQSQ